MNLLDCRPETRQLYKKRFGYPSEDSSKPTHGPECGSLSSVESQIRDITDPDDDGPWGCYPFWQVGSRKTKSTHVAILAIQIELALASDEELEKIGQGPFIIYSGGPGRGSNCDYINFLDISEQAQANINRISIWMARYLFEKHEEDPMPWAAILYKSIWEFTATRLMGNAWPSEVEDFIYSDKDVFTTNLGTELILDEIRREAGGEQEVKTICGNLDKMGLEFEYLVLSREIDVGVVGFLSKRVGKGDNGQDRG